jgi:hypothetical protein
MTALVVIGSALLLVLVHQVTKAAVIAWRQAGHCRHEDLTRHWWKNHVFSIWCKQCARIIGTGRDPKHGPYPKEKRAA